MSISAHSQPLPCVGIIGDADGLPVSVEPGPCDPTADTWKTIFQLWAPENLVVQVKEISLGFDGKVVSDEPLMVQVVRQAGDVAGWTEVYPSHELDAQGETWTEQHRPIQTRCLTNLVGDPITGDIVRAWHVRPQGNITYPYHPSRKKRNRITVMPDHRLGIRISAENDVQVTGYVLFEEGSTL